jgi:hypothetical protein
MTRTDIMRGMETADMAPPSAALAIVGTKAELAETPIMIDLARVASSVGVFNTMRDVVVGIRRADVETNARIRKNKVKGSITYEISD